MANVESVVYERVRLDALQLAIERTVSRHSRGFNDLQLDHYGYLAHEMVLRLSATVFARDEADQHFDTPASVWDYIKHQYWPAWALKRWPVRFKRTTFTVKAKYPTLIHRGERHSAYLDIVVGPTVDFPPSRVQ